jgi:hypothetical protein
MDKVFCANYTLYEFAKPKFGLKYEVNVLL